ncbi:MAG: restriction endonuclease subunit S [Geobacteraceae bacterium]|nr:restriction endonuclease subunit S [Geobacteraceae bacterium]
MRKGWKTVTIEDIAVFYNSKRVPLNSRDREKRKGKYPYYGASGIVDYIDDYLFDGEFVLISEDGENLRSRNTPIAFKANGKFWVNNHAHIVKGKEPFLNDWIMYCFKNLDLNSYITGAVQPKLNKENLQLIEIQIPDFEIAKKIVSILSALDEKIELNRQTNHTLEAIAQTLFKEWFVDFNFPGATGEMQESELGPIPVGWCVYKLEELIDTVSITHKFDTDEVVFLNTSDIESGKVLNHSYSKVEGLPGQAKKSIRKLDILFTEIRPANKRFALIDFDADDYVVSTKLMVLRSKVDIHPIVIYNYLTSDEILNWLQHLAESRSGTFPQITFSQVKELKIALPTDDLLNAYVNIAWPAFEVVSNCDRETKALVEIRDSLLPKLMNGEIEV